MAGLLGPDGKPWKKAQLSDEVAVPTISGVRSVWTDTQASGLTPVKLAGMLKNASDGDPRDYLILAEEMEERDAHYASVLGTRKRALSGIEPVVHAASDDKQDQMIAEAVRELVAEPEFADLVDDLLDGLGKGYSVVEIIWKHGALFKPVGYVHRPPQWFTFDRLSGQEIRLINGSHIEGEPLAPFKFIAHRPKLKTGLSMRGGLARLVAWAFLFKSYSLKDWMAFLEVFGMPLRIGTYGSNASADDIRTLVRAVTNLGSDAGAVIPESMRIELKEAAGSKGGAEGFLAICKYLDEQVSKAVLGQTMTADSGSSQAQAKVHNEVRHDILRADARQLGSTINRDLVAPFVALNYGRDIIPPRVVWPVLEPEDVGKLVDNVVKLVPFGLKVEASVLRDKLNLPDPPKGAEVLVAPAGKVEPTTDVKPDKKLNRALQKQDQDGDSDVIDELEDWFGDWQPVIEPVIKPFEDLANKSETAEEFLAQLDQVVDQVSTEEFEADLVQAMMAARAVGDLDA